MDRKKDALDLLRKIPPPLLLAVAVGGIILLLVLFSGPEQGRLPVKGVKALTFTAVDLSGQKVSLSDYRGKVVLLDFWATWCSPCLMELPHIKRVYDRYKNDGFTVIGISLNTDRTELETLVRMVGIEWPQIFDGKGWENEISRLYNVYSLPATFLVDQKGLIRYVNLRGEQELDRAVRELLGKEKVVQSPAAY
ncbi:MAG: TlpA family protein disulfide reductase [Candidatus Abyssobacteria bacterium SURF_5]|uniref:TlpA family protein disulfide reductase n=1 Tax=Abyssobacteria bacterium (strain SURF_5) TaxID=2093360 RepID=A0A3A4P6D1_ABYX5|nr:MAG: TlpA family protein disulfide reductase [Candidatus Abyssubacteria bacterium SURF_5]